MVFQEFDQLPPWKTVKQNVMFALLASGTLKRREAEERARLAPGQTMLVEYKPFEPAFYHTDIADWGMAA